MPASAKTMEMLNALPPADVIAAAGAAVAAGGFVAFTKKIGLWERFNKVERHESELLDQEMPQGWWQKAVGSVAAARFSNHKILWERGDWKTRGTANGSLVIQTPMLDEDTGELVT